MAQLHTSRFRATDANNAVISGAGLFVYEPGTTTKVTLYSDHDLAAPRANPVESLATGYFPQFYTASGISVDIYAYTTTSVASTLLWQELEIDALGSEDIGTFFRDFDGNGRLQAVGTGGGIRLEAMPPTGDNIGGTLTVSGAAGTALDSGDWVGPLDISGAVTIGGTLSVTGVSAQYEQLLVSGTATGAASVEIALSASYDSYRLIVTQVKGTLSASLTALFSFDGTTYKTGVADYYWRWIGLALPATFSNGRDISDATMTIGGIVPVAAAAQPARYDINIDSATGLESGISGMAYGANLDDAGETNIMQFVAGTLNRAFGKAQKIKLTPSAGVITCRYALFGIPGL